MSTNTIESPTVTDDMLIDIYLHMVANSVKHERTKVFIKGLIKNMSHDKLVDYYNKHCR